MARYEQLPFQAVRHERRQWPRHRLEVPVSIARIQLGKVATIMGWAEDLSRGGLAVFLPVDLAVGETVEIAITLPKSGRPVHVRGIVRGRQGFRYGIEFRGVGPAMWPIPKLAAKSAGPWRPQPVVPSLTRISDVIQENAVSAD